MEDAPYKASHSSRPLVPAASVLTLKVFSLHFLPDQTTLIRNVGFALLL